MTTKVKRKKAVASNSVEVSPKQKLVQPAEAVTDIMSGRLSNSSLNKQDERKEKVK